ncbi:uncharacterized protein LOC142605721 [Castanea sativa]|uniref:uncharacterized protein LOC142605721 n=1 Tax=Castanea sativa TaxID=21020 RepID=UPI003F65337E
MASTTMKTVSGRVLSSKPISLKKATTTLSTFVASDNGAPPVISAYLRRALSAFKELRQHEKELRAPGSDRTSDWSKSEFLSEGDTVGVNSSQIQSIEVSQAPSHKPKKRLRPESIDSFGENLIPAENGSGGENSGRAAESGHGDQETSLEIESDRKKHKKKKKKKKKEEDDNIESVRSGGDRMVIEEEAESNKKNKKKKKKKKKKNDGGDYENNGIEAEEEDNIGIEEVKKEESKKRKSVEEVEVEADGKIKKKRRKTG